ncbi:MAG: site-2 protease family protein [Parachlamydiaceae bacterium]
MFTIKSLPIRIDPLFWLLAFGLGFYYSGNLAGIFTWGLIILVSVLVHELGHALTAQAFGQEARITLTFFGGVTQRAGPPIAKWKEFLIVLNGPLAGFALAFFTFWLSFSPFVRNSPTLFTAVTIGYYVNYFWTILNLFPIQPLDGGHLLMIFLEGLLGYRGIKLAYFLSGFIAVCLGMLFFLLQQMFIGAILFIFAFESFKNWKMSLPMTYVDQNEQLKQEVDEAERLVAHGHFHEGQEKLLDIINNQSQKKGLLYFKAARLLAIMLYENEEYNQAFNFIAPLEQQLDVSGLALLQKIAFKSERYEDAVRIGTRVHQEEANAEVAYLNALSNAELKEKQATLGWLKTAIEEGLSDLPLKLKDHRFAFIKDSIEFKKFS